MRGREFDGSVFALSFSKSRQRFGCLALAILPVAVSTRASARSPGRPLDEMAHPSSVSPSSDLIGNRMIASTLPMIAVNRFSPPSRECRDLSHCNPHAGPHARLAEIRAQYLHA